MSKYAVGDKFIVEIKEVLNDELPYDTENLYRIDGFKTLVFDDYGLDKLQQINPKLKIEDIDDMLAEHDLKKESYEKGLNDAWELARKIVLTTEMGGICYDDFKKIFGVGNFVSVLRTMTAQQALAKIEAYEESRAIKVWDVVKHNESKEYAIVICKCSDGKYKLLFEDSDIVKAFDSEFTKTGKTADILSIFEQIRGDS